MKAVESRGIAIVTFLLLFSASGAQAEQSNKLPRIGYISGTLDIRNAGFEALRQGLRDLGYIEGKNVAIEYRYTEGKRERISEFVTELLKLPVDVLVSPTPSVIRAARDATKTVPIIMVTTSDPVATGIVDSLAHPGRNITGVTRFTRELSGKRLELLKEAIPGLSRVGLLLGTDATTNLAAKEYETAAHALRLALQPLGVSSPNPDLTGALQTAVKARVGALIVVRATALNSYSVRIAELAKKGQLPSMYEVSEGVEAGGLMSYAADEAESYRRAATYVDKILKGAKPADLPVERPKKFELAINLKSAKQIGLIIPPNVLARADRVIK
jgi:putative tryptophan/tyrosine transport system substrate-binding protein